MTLCGPILSESFPSLGAAIILASPEAEKTIPATRAMWPVSRDNWAT